MKRIIKGSKKGFTLIELLVVIAIIAILSTVVIGGLQSARAKGADAGIKANLGNIRAQAELVFDNHGCYNDHVAPGGAACLATAVSINCASTAGSIFAEPSVLAALTAAGTSSGPPGLTRGMCRSSAGQTAWAVSYPLKSDSNLHWCVDSAGLSKQISAALPSSQTFCTP